MGKQCDLSPSYRLYIMEKMPLVVHGLEGYCFVSVISTKAFNVNDHIIEYYVAIFVIAHWQRQHWDLLPCVPPIISTLNYTNMTQF